MYELPRFAATLFAQCSRGGFGVLASALSPMQLCQPFRGGRSVSHIAAVRFTARYVPWLSQLV